MKIMKLEKGSMKKALKQLSITLIFGGVLFLALTLISYIMQLTELLLK